MKPIPLLTERLNLRSAHKDDAEYLFQYYFSDNNLCQFLTRKAHTHIDQTKKFLYEWCEINWQIESNHFAWVISITNTNQAIGVFLVNLNENNAQIHYGICSSFSNQGYITEAGNKIISWLKKQTPIQRIWAVCDMENHSSRRVLEKLNFQNQGILKNWLLLPAYNNSPRDCYEFIYPLDTP